MPAPVDQLAPQAPDVAVAAPATFAELNLSPAVLQSLTAAGFVKPTPIQAQFIPLVLAGRDVMGQAKTGTGKTAAFLVPMFEMFKPRRGNCQALILAPTREL
ncbi:MAG: DEAD/DEAH box helicase, partial [Planctomycetota bacterium]|nr:DEAD/DEAH box helicase [Planctomycetota bacterium]